MVSWDHMFVSGEDMFVSLRGVVDLQVLRLRSASFQGNAGGMCRQRGFGPKASQITEHHCWRVQTLGPIGPTGPTIPGWPL